MPAQAVGPGPTGEKLVAAQRIGIGEDLAVLHGGIDAFIRMLPPRGDERHARALVAAEVGVDLHHLALLPGMVPGGHREEPLRAGNLPRVEQRGGKPGVRAVQCGLPGAVEVHLEQGLGEHLSAVVIVPARVDDPPVVRGLGVPGLDLVDGQPPDETAVAVHLVEVAHLGVPAGHALFDAGGGEDDRFVGQVGPFVVGDSQAVGELADVLAVGIEFVEMVIVVAPRLLPGDEDGIGVETHVRIADHARSGRPGARGPRARWPERSSRQSELPGVKFRS